MPPSQSVHWRAASFCAGGECVQVAAEDGEIFVRSSADPQQIVRFTAEEWLDFTTALRRGEFDGLQSGESAG